MPAKVGVAVGGAMVDVGVVDDAPELDPLGAQALIAISASTIAIEVIRDLEAMPLSDRRAVVCFTG